MTLRLHTLAALDPALEWHERGFYSIMPAWVRSSDHSNSGTGIAKHRAMRMAAWRIADKRAKDAGEQALRAEAVRLVCEELQRYLRQNRSAK
jgi:hypothetical protein